MPGNYCNSWFVILGRLLLYRVSKETNIYSLPFPKSTCTSIQALVRDFKLPLLLTGVREEAELEWGNSIILEHPCATARLQTILLYISDQVIELAPLRFNIQSWLV